MSGCLEFLKCVLCCVEEREEDPYVVLGSRSRNNSSDVGSGCFRSVERTNDRFQSFYSRPYAPIYSDDLPASSSALTQSSSKLLPPSAPLWPKPPASSSNQSQSSRAPATVLSRPSPFQPVFSTTASKPSPDQATTLSFKSSLLPPPPSTSSSKSSHQDPIPAFHPSPSPKPLPSFLKPPTSSSNQSQSSRVPATVLSKPSPFPSVPSTTSSKPSPHATTLSFKSSPFPPPPSTSSSKSSHQDPNPAFHPSPSPKPLPSFLKPPTSSSNQSQSSRVPATVLSKPSPFPSVPSTTSSKPSPQATTLSFKSSPFPTPPSTSSSKSSHQDPNPAFHPSPSPKPLPSFLKPSASSSKPSPSSSKASPSSPEPSSSSKQPSSFKPTLSLASPNLINEQTKVSYSLVQKVMSPIYAVPKVIEDLIKRDIVPEVLNEMLSPSTYKDYFAALLYAEDFYIEKWSKFKLKNITLKLKDAAIIKKRGRKEYFSESHEKDNKTFVEFEIDSCREKRPFLLSRDFAFARPSGQKTEPYQGVIYRVVRSTIVLVEFGEDFHLQHYSTREYDVSFSFNRVCLKRAHQAIEAASDPSFKNFLFPDFVHRKSIPTSTPLHFINHKLDAYQRSAVHEILSFRGPPPYLVEGPLCSKEYSKQLSRIGLVVQEAVLQIYQSSSKHRILICAPINRTCDVLMQSLKIDIPESDMFRANAAFREIDGVPIDILTSCVYKRDCFTCPSIRELRKFRVILSTFVSSFRLHNEGIVAGHFSHIFLVNASSATEPEAMVALANLASENTAVIVTGAPGNHSGWVRSNIARENGLMTSYFERLRDSKPYWNSHPKFIRQLVDPESKSVDSYSYAHESLWYD
ncbi:hypothetical protein H0E87_010196 [Populus deltoides]|uniref:Helicase MOV-10-like beta-barrel domain-containing protein n=1 Tax=Populus deltoides TaxID=3696 RepID=A0A8T2YSC6_POPDE|nr:hypothetical protein H0E87_010196 [Populus deltoides]